MHWTFCRKIGENQNEKAIHSRKIRLRDLSRCIIFTIQLVCEIPQQNKLYEQKWEMITKNLVDWINLFKIHMPMYNVAASN